MKLLFSACLVVVLGALAFSLTLLWTRYASAATFDERVAAEEFIFQTPGEPYSVTAPAAPSRVGPLVLRFELRPGDVYCGVECRGRAELADPEKRPLGTSLWYRFSVLFPQGVYGAGDWQIFWQAHVWPSGGASQASPPVSFSLQGGRLYVKVNSGNRESPTKRTVLSGYSLARACWHDFLVNVKVDSLSWRGYLKVWRQGRLILSYAGPVGYVGDVNPVTNKAGIYRSNKATVEPSSPNGAFIVHIDEMRSGLTQADVGTLPAASTQCP